MSKAAGPGVERRSGADRRRAAQEQAKMQAQLQQAQRLENLGELAGGVAHDFNNLLAVILNYVAFAVEDLTGATGPDWARRRESALSDLGQIERSAQRAASLTRQLLAFARREVIQPRVLDLNEVVITVEDMLRRTLGEDVELVTSLAGDLEPVLADPGQLEQVLVNLAVNARDAMPGGGTLTIETSNITVDDDYIAGGSGATAGTLRAAAGQRHRHRDGTRRDRARVRAVLHHQADGRGDRPRAGHRLRDRHAGRGPHPDLLRARRRHDVHASPCRSPRRPPAPRPEPATYHRAPTGETILVVEDEAALRDVTERSSPATATRSSTAASGPEALRMARDHPGEIHLLVTDVVMPRMLGQEVAEKIARSSPASRSSTCPATPGPS